MTLEQCNVGDVINYLLQQQLFKEPFYLIDRTSKKQMKITCSSKIIEKMYEKIFSISKLWEERGEIDFIESLTNILGIEFEEVYSIYKIKSEALDDREEAECLRFMFALSESIHLFQKKAIEEAHFQILKKFDFDKEVLNQVLGILSQNADQDLSIYQNFYILKKYSDIVNIKLEQVIISKVFNKIVKKVEKSYKKME
ncbi:MAG: hypothetical protein K9W45_01165 [Candidatus Heimdallarchaeum aukensis]|uniref:Uncharacterized protein n=1 Tax=Candidatus Heimdallarchaeum aukensis TaxID=2876573 RepID=A0A9Y1BLH7_9ARCH|nr:MAG: hypothetical protein K9W45_01165 [Candidatus Heimdallarchaeum aukensis]